MDGSNPFSNAHFEETGNGSHVSTLSCNPQVDHENFISLSAEETTKAVIQELLDPPIDEKDDLLFQEASDTLSRHGDGLGEPLLVSNFAPDQDETLNSKEAKVSQDSSSLLLDANKKIGVSKSASLFCSADAQCFSSTVVPSNAENDPATFKLVSAIKGSRAQNGTSPDVKLHVKWASDVYDPPSSSMSHTAKKSHHQQSKAKRKDTNKHKHKHNKGKSSCRNSEKRTGNHDSRSEVKCR